MTKAFFSRRSILLFTALFVVSGFFVFAQPASAISPTLPWSDGFESGDFSAWTSHDTRWSVSSSDTHGGSAYKAEASGNTGIN